MINEYLMCKISIGLAGFFYKDWIGNFYPKNLENNKYLEYYSKFFDIIEINSTFYNLPSEGTVLNWKNQVPDNFRFIIKIWKKITHEFNESDISSRVILFFNRMANLKEKIAAFLIQFPPWFKYSDKNLKQLMFILNEFPPNYNYIIELRDDSWFKLNILSKFIDGSKKILGTTYIPQLTPFYLANQKTYYIRLIGNRELTLFNRIQREQTDAISNLYKEIQKLKNNSKVHEIFIIVNNHFQGNAPESANLLKKMFNLQFKSFNQQKKLSDYL